MSEPNKYRQSITHELDSERQKSSALRERLTREYEAQSRKYARYRGLFDSTVKTVDQMADALELTNRTIFNASVHIVPTILVSLSDYGSNYVDATNEVMKEIVWWQFCCKYEAKKEFFQDLGKPSLVFELRIDQEERLFGTKYPVLKMKWKRWDAILATRYAASLDTPFDESKVRSQLVGSLEDLFENAKRFLIKDGFLN